MKLGTGAATSPTGVINTDPFIISMSMYGHTEPKRPMLKFNVILSYSLFLFMSQVIRGVH